MKDFKVFIFTVMIGILCILLLTLYRLFSTSATDDVFLPVKANPSASDIEFAITNDWGSGFGAEIYITNTSNKVITDWGLEFDFDREIISFSGAEMVSYENNHFVIKNAVYNNAIQPNETVTVAFSAKGGSNSEPANYSLTKRPDSTEIENNNYYNKRYRKIKKAYRRRRRYGIK